MTYDANSLGRSLLLGLLLAGSGLPLGAQAPGSGPATPDAAASPRSAAGPAQEAARLPPADYARAEAFLGSNAERLVHGGAISPNWMGGEDRFWYRTRFAEGFEFVLVDIAAGERRRAFDHERLAAALSRVSDEDYEPFDLPFNDLLFVDGEQGLVVQFEREGEEVAWHCDLREYRCMGPMEAWPPVPNSVPSPDGRYLAYIQDHDLWVRDLRTGDDIQLTSDGEERYGYAADSQGWRRTDMPVLAWSPDSRRIATYRLDERDVEEMHLLEMAEPRPILHSWPYAVPGDSILPMHERVVIQVEEREVVLLDLPPDHQRTSSCCGLTRGPFWADIEWSEDAEVLAFASTSRDYRTVTLRLADPGTGSVRDVFEESHPRFFLTNIRSGGVPNWRVLHDRGEFIWFSERDGWGHLYLYDLESGELLRQLTRGDWNVVDILRVDEEEGRIVFTGVGREDGRNPYFRQLYSLSLEGGEPRLLTEEDGNHDVALSPSGRYFVSARSTPDEAPISSVYRAADGRLVLTVEEADTTELEAIGWSPPTPFTALARDGVTEIHGLLYRPSDFDPSRSYPVINSIYPGPQSGSISSWGFDPNPRGQAHALAELGFVVVQVDAPGTPFRSKAFHGFYYGDMADNGLEDQKAAIEQLAARYDWIDLERVGIVGHSGGGYATAAALLRFPDFFKVGVASAGNHDNRGYTDYWGERWQGPFEVGEDRTDSYEHQALHPLAGELEGRLLLSYGTMDANVHPNLTLLLVDALIEQGHDFDLMVFPNRGHGYANEPYNLRITWDYFVTHLLGATPPAGYRIGR